MDCSNPSREKDLFRAQMPEVFKSLAASFATLPMEFHVASDDVESHKSSHAKTNQHNDSTAATNVIAARLTVLQKQKEETLSALDIFADEQTQETLRRDLKMLNSQISDTQICLAVCRFQQLQEN